MGRWDDCLEVMRVGERRDGDGKGRRHSRDEGESGRNGMRRGKDKTREGRGRRREEKKQGWKWRETKVGMRKFKLRDKQGELIKIRGKAGEGKE